MAMLVALSKHAKISSSCSSRMRALLYRKSIGLSAAIVMLASCRSSQVKPPPSTLPLPSTSALVAVTTTTEDPELAFDSLAESLSTDVRLLTPGTLTACIDSPFPPFEYSKQSDGEDLSGIDIDILSALAKNNKLAVAFVETPFENIFQALREGRCDVIASAVPVTPTRAKSFDFTRTYLTVRQSLLVRATDSRTYVSLDSLAGKTIGVQTGSVASARFRAHPATGVTVLEFPGRFEMLAALRVSQLDALIADSPINGFEADQSDGALAVSAIFDGDEQRYAFVVAKNNPVLTSSLNASLAKLADRGLLRKTIVGYIGSTAYLS